DTDTRVVDRHSMLHSRLRVRAAGAREDALRCDHAVIVVGCGLTTDQDHGFTATGPLPCLVRAEHDLPGCGARRRVEAPRDRLDALLGTRLLVHAPLEQ